MKRRVDDINIGSIKMNIAYIIACLIGAIMLISAFLLNERNFNQGIGAIFGLVLVINSIILTQIKSNKKHMQQISIGTMILATCSGLYFSLIPLVYNSNSKGPLLVYLISIIMVALIRFISKTYTIESIKNKSLVLLKLDLVVTTISFITYFLYVIIYSNNLMNGKFDIKTILILCVLLNICTFCVSGLVTIYFRHKYDIKFDDKRNENKGGNLK